MVRIIPIYFRYEVRPFGRGPTLPDPPLTMAWNPFMTLVLIGKKPYFGLQKQKSFGFQGLLTTYIHYVLGSHPPRLDSEFSNPEEAQGPKVFHTVLPWKTPPAVGSRAVGEFFLSFFVLNPCESIREIRDGSVKFVFSLLMFIYFANKTFGGLFG